MTAGDTAAVIAAAGSSARMGRGLNKQFCMLQGVPVLARTLQAFDAASAVAQVIVVTREPDISAVRELVREYGIQKVTEIAAGGDTRQSSVQRGLAFVRTEKVLIHDGARPFVTPAQIQAVAQALDTCDAAALGVPVKDTLKRIDSQGLILDTVPREDLVQIQTPQGFRTQVILRAHAQAAAQGLTVTDDCALAEYLGIPVRVAPGSSLNFKVTTPEDLELAQGLLESRKDRR